MDIIEFAMKMESDGKAYYEKLSAETDDKELKEILDSLAEEEGRHYEYFRRLKKDISDTSGSKSLMGSKTLNTVKNVFEQLAANDRQEQFGEDVVSAWTRALRTEEKSEQFYKEKADQETDSEKRKLLLKIAGEENNHIHMISGVIFYLKSPEAFGDSSHFKEFRSLEGWGEDF
jgi:rubrerythrin